MDRTRRYDKDNGQQGILAPSAHGWAYMVQNLTANRAYFSRFTPSRDMTIVSFGFAVSTASSTDDACDIGLYDATGTKIITAGATTGKLNSTGVKSIALAASLYAGLVYYAGFSCGTIGGTTPQLVMANWIAAQGGQLFGATLGVADAWSQNTAHPLPTNMSSATVGITSTPVVVLKEV